MSNKRHFDEPESSSSKRLNINTSSSILKYFKSHYNYQTFNSKDLLVLLNCETPETAKKEAKNQMNGIIDLKHIKEEVKIFVSSLLIDDLKCLSDSNADLYWAEKKNISAFISNSHKQLLIYHGVSSTILDKTLVSVQSDDQSNISVNESSSPSISAETDPFIDKIWLIWSDVLYNMLTGNGDDKDIHEYSLEHLGIIVLGNHIGNKQSRKSYPKELVLKTNKTIQIPVVDIFQNLFSFYSPLFETLVVSLDECHNLLLKESLKVKESNDPGLQFTYDFLMIFVTQILNKTDVLSKQESIYNYRAIFRFLDAVVSVTPSCTFFPGETRLQAINKELERSEMSKKSYYNADGIILDNDTGLELCLMETSGPFGLIDISRETTDQVKAAYGLLAMLHTVARKFVYADIQEFKKLSICFVHVAQDRIRLWSFSLIDKELYVLNRVDSGVLPKSNSNQFKNDFIHLTNLFWKLKLILDSAKSSIENIKASHIKNEIAYCNGKVKKLQRLDSYLVENAEVKLSSRVSQVSDIFISSSP